MCENQETYQFIHIWWAKCNKNISNEIQWNDISKHIIHYTYIHIIREWIGKPMKWHTKMNYIMFKWFKIKIKIFKWKKMNVILLVSKWSRFKTKMKSRCKCNKEK